LFLSNSENKNDYFNKILVKILNRFSDLRNDTMETYDMLRLISYIEAGFLLNNVINSFKEYNFLQRSKVLWQEYANTLSEVGFEKLKDIWSENGK